MKAGFGRRDFAGLAIMALGSRDALAATPPNALMIGTDLGAIPSLDPAAINARTPSEVVSNLYDNLVQVPPTRLDTILPMLAESWAVSGDKRTITMTLRKGATFASGNPVTAEDAAWTIQRVIKMAAVGATDIAACGFTTQNVERAVQAPDPQTLTLQLPEPVATDLVLYALAGASLGIVDRQAALRNERNGDLAQNWLKANSAGSGPYKLTQWRPNDILLCDARNDYWDGAPGMRRVVMRHVPESGNKRLQIEAGDMDVAQYMANGDIEALQAHGATVDPGPGLGFYYIALNQADPDLAKPKVREAFQHVLDWKPLIATTMNFNGFAWQSIIPKGLPGAPTGEPDSYQYDPDLARRLLAEAGYPNGLKKTLFPSGDALLKMAVTLQASARKAGVELEIVPGEHTPDFRARKFEVLVGNSGSRLPDPYGTLLQYAYNPDNRDEAKLGGYYLWRTGLDAPELTRMVIASKAELDPAKRKEIFEKIDRDFKALPPPLIVFMQRTDPSVCRKGVSGYVGHPHLVDPLVPREEGLTGAPPVSELALPGRPPARPLRAGRVRKAATRVASLVTTLLGLAMLVFAMGRLLPADPVLAVTGSEVDRATYERVYHELGLDRPVWQQFTSYVGHVATGDFGASLTTGRPVADDLLTVFPATLELALVAIVCGTLLGVPLGVAAAVHRGRLLDHVARVVGLAGHSVPIFWLGLMGLLLFYAKLGWVAASGRIDVMNEGMVPPVTGLMLVDASLAGDWGVFRDALSHIILPGAIMGYYSAAYISRMTRSFMLEQLGQEYIVAAHAKGMSRRRVVWMHAFYNIRVQLLTVLALTFGGLLDGAVLIETVFGWPGLGQYLTRGLRTNDMNVVMGAVLLIGSMFLAINLLSDQLYRILDPRTR